MWIAKPLYEAIPYLYLALGALFVALSWFRTTGVASVLLFVCGAGLLLIGGVLWLRRRDFRDTQKRYDGRSLDDV